MGPKSIRMFFEPLRKMGASARQMLINAAAKEWRVPAKECSTNKGTVLHAKTSREAKLWSTRTYGTRATVPENITLKPRDQFKYIGKGLVHVDAENIATGQATFGADVSAPKHGGGRFDSRPQSSCKGKESLNSGRMEAQRTVRCSRNNRSDY